MREVDRPQPTTLANNSFPQAIKVKPVRRLYLPAVSIVHAYSTLVTNLASLLDFPLAPCSVILYYSGSMCPVSFTEKGDE